MKHEFSEKALVPNPALQQFAWLVGEWRKVSRKYDVSVVDGIIKWERSQPSISQRYAWRVIKSGDGIVGEGELSKDGKTWEKDLDQTFTRIK